MTVRMASLAVATFLLSCGAQAAGLPDWLLGDWIVTKVYQPDDAEVHYRTPDAEPVARWTGKVLTVEANRLHLGSDICTDLTARERRDTVRHLVPGHEPEKLGLVPRPGRLPYWHVACGRSLSEDEDGLEDRHDPDITWMIIPDGHDRIDLIFLPPCYLELRRKDKPVS